MMMNLFDMFNPMSSSLILSNWTMIMIMILIPSKSFWLKPSTFIHSIKLMMKFISSQFKPSLMKFNVSSIMMFCSLMIMILMMNYSGLFPFIFTNSSHISFNLILSVPMWFSFVLFKTFNLMKLMSHFTPLSTPTYLISFMSMIELISFLIQPITLAIRLTANITAGHLLLTLISSTMLSLMTIMPMMIPQIMFLILEMMVAIIQAYVFSTLLIMFMK